MSNIIELSRKIKIPKNRIRMFTVDKDGKETGKSREFTNLWTSYGYENFWLSTVGIDSALFSVSNGANAGGAIVPTLFISSGNTNITVSSTSLTGTTRSTNTSVSNYNGVSYDRFDEVSINGHDYYKITMLKSFPHGNVNFSVGQVGIYRSTQGLLCGTRLNDESGNFNPFPVTADEQLNVMYSIFIPVDLTYIYQTDGNIWQTVPVLINGETAVNFNFRRNLIAVNTQSGGNGILFYNFLNTWVNNIRCYFNNTNVSSDVSNSLIRSNSNKTAEITYSFTITPGQFTTETNISRFHIQHATSNQNALLCTIAPPIVKGPDDRVNISFKYTIEIDEEDF